MNKGTASFTPEVVAYMNEVANYYKGTYNMNTAITNRPTTIEFSYIEVMDAEDIQVYGD